MYLERLEKERDNILFCEIGAMLHDLGKLSREFVEYQSSHSNEIAFFHSRMLRRAEMGHYKDVLKITQSEVGRFVAKVRELYIDWQQKNKSVSSEEWKQIEHDLSSQAANDIFPSSWENDSKYKDAACFASEGFIKLDFVSVNLIKMLNSDCIHLLLPGEDPLASRPITLGDFIEQHDKRDFEGFVAQNLRGINKSRMPIRWFRQCDKIDSGADKGLTPDKAKQLAESAFLSTVFGVEKGHVCKLDEYVSIRNQLAEYLTNAIKKLFEKRKSYADGCLSVEDWNEFLYASNDNGFQHKVREAFLFAMADTRRSANDVTLWDHSYAVASLFKSILAQVVIENDPERRSALDEPKKGISKDIKWHILRINIDILGILAKAHRIGDILGYQNVIRDTFKSVKRLLEIEYPIGNEVYQDESGIYFTFPNLKETLLNDVKSEIAKAIRQLPEVQLLDVQPVVKISQKSSRSLTLIATEIDLGYKEGHGELNALPNWTELWEEMKVAQEDLTKWEELRSSLKYPLGCTEENCRRRFLGCTEISCKKRSCTLAGGKNDPEIERCPVCLLRPKCEHSKLCHACSDRRVRRMREWMKKPTDTIWLEEVADSNGHIALITGQFELSQWLNGTCVDSLLTQSLPRKNHEVIKYHELLEKIRSCLDNDIISPLLRDMCQGYVKEQLDPSTVEDRSYRKEISFPPESVDYAYMIMRKHPCPSRLRRVWETSERFWQEDINQFLQEKYSYKGGDLRQVRVAFKPKSSIPLDLKHLEQKAYDDAEIHGMRLSVFWHKEQKQFISIINLETLAQKLGASTVEKLRERLSGESLRVRLDDEENTPPNEQQWLNIQVELEECDEHFREYIPYIPILTTSPLSFIALVPATDAMDILQGVRDHYQKQFSKVANRLPIRLGSFFFPRHLPLYVVMDTARRMMDHFRWKSEEGKWEVRSKPVDDETKKTVTLQLEKVGKTGEIITRKVSYALGDPEIGHVENDYYYPYFFVVEPDFDTLSEDKDCPRPNLLQWPHPDTDRGWIPMVHVTELKEGDVVLHLDSRFDFEYIDSIQQRLEVRYDQFGQRVHTPLSSLRGPRPYYLKALDDIPKLWKLISDYDGLTITQIQNIRETLTGALQRWGLSLDRVRDEASKRDTASKRNTFRRFAEQTFQNYSDGNWWKKLGEKNDDQFLLDACCSGLFFDVLELYLTVLKEKPKRSK